tara:strand:+ start:29 stop:274 length:246 start_codon:yes stop_codon:yes gene_type:complete
MKKSTNTLIKNIRLNILKLTYKAKSAHIGSALSIVKILAIFYNEILNITPKKTKIISKYINNKVIYTVGSKNYLLNKFGPK